MSRPGIITTLLFMALSCAAAQAATDMPRQAVSTANMLNLRSGPSPSHSITGTLALHQEVTIMETLQSDAGYTWYRVQTENQQGFAFGKYLHLLPQEPRQPVAGKVQSYQLNVRSMPSAQGSVVRVLEQGELVTVEREIPNGLHAPWYEIRLAQEQRGFVYSAHITLQRTSTSGPMTATVAEPPLAKSPAQAPETTAVTASPAKFMAPRERMEHLNKADLFYRQGRLYESLLLYKHVVQHSHPSRSLLINIVYLQGQLGRDGHAHAFIDQHPEHKALLAYSYAIGFLEGQRPLHELTSSLQQYLPSDHNGMLTFLLGSIREQQGEYAAAQRHYFQAMERDPSSAHFRYAAARMGELNGQTAQARQLYQSVVRSANQQLAQYARTRLQQLEPPGVW
ncbi:SH3 type 3 domain protein [Desulfurispirillum indicum S5]|uniref:SH3 type 3 domain protein n=1 Tax=Desulfurispirillum indicum (strain ATCC BAA-1389 / DSM 22839 / S5) TaxID=653733 RepID=E6W613_DESIS|nr:SH3 domain-containing protein [Desulfurispirillum indicum]ADU64952.1 SH3 type 3 domain protein [Desulfurispirillum indicum S5]